MSGFLGPLQAMIARISPWFLQQKNIGTFLQANAVVQDQLLNMLGTGLQLSNPLLCDASSLPILSNDRTIDLYPGEPIASQRVRLSQWLQLHRSYGCAIGEMRNLVPFWQYTFPGRHIPRMRIVSTSGGGGFTNWWTLNSDGSTSYQVYSGGNWNWDGVTSAWSRIWLIVYLDRFGFTYPRWDGGGIWDDGVTGWDLGSYVYNGVTYSGLTWAQIQTIIASFNSRNGSKAAHSTLWGILTTTDPTSFDPTSPITSNTGAGSNLPDGNWAWPVNPATGYRSWPTTTEVVYNLGVA